MTMDASVTHGSLKFAISGAKNCSITQGLADSGEFYELDFLESLRQHVSRGDWVIDGGAHIGNHSIFMAGVLSLNVLAFEPHPETFAQLRANLEANGLSNPVRTINRALDETARSVVLTPNSRGDMGSFSIANPRNDVSVSVKSVALDDYLDYFEGKRLALIKLDVERAELRVLRGARRMLRTYKPVVAVEAQDVKDFEAIMHYMVGLGYLPVAVHNATPTLTFVPERTKVGERELGEILSYAIAKTGALNSLSRPKPAEEDAKVEVSDETA